MTEDFGGSHSWQSRSWGTRMGAHRAARFGDGLPERQANPIPTQWDRVEGADTCEGVFIEI